MQDSNDRVKAYAWLLQALLQKCVTKTEVLQAWPVTVIHENGFR